jgi:hypothetical protein
VIDFVIALAFVAMVLTPAVVASFQAKKTQDNDL